ncbi:MAG: hypothetical protein IT370_35805 [Deltaproteobacteria bacterium]|nr:hypothetical protein [Deltaproteobacteria bacterium]
MIALLIVGLLALAGGIHLGVTSRGTFRTWLALWRTPTSAIADVRADAALLELTGTVLAPARPVTDPASGAPCVYYQHGDSCAHTDFVLDDGTGRAHIQLAGAVVVVRGGGDVVIAPGDKIYVLGPATHLPGAVKAAADTPDADADAPATPSLRLAATARRALFVAELSEQDAGRRLGLRAAAALTLGGLLCVIGVAAVLLQLWLVWTA